MTKITDDMVGQAIKAWGSAEGGLHAAMRRGLEAALNPSVEPEIEVTEEMLLAGYRACGLLRDVLYPKGPDAWMRSAYRAMYAARPNPRIPPSWRIGTIEPLHYRSHARTGEDIKLL